MNQSKFPNRDEERVKGIISHCDEQAEDEMTFAGQA
jgi:hypothetical protein